MCMWEKLPTENSRRRPSTCAEGISCLVLQIGKRLTGQCVHMSCIPSLLVRRLKSLVFISYFQNRRTGEIAKISLLTLFLGLCKNRQKIKQNITICLFFFSSYTEKR